MVIAGLAWLLTGGVTVEPVLSCVFHVQRGVFPSRPGGTSPWGPLFAKLSPGAKNASVQ